MKFIGKMILISAAALGITDAYAGVIIGGTRVIFDGAKKEASINVNNPDSSPYLIQSWVDMPQGENNKAPFVITPPLYRLEGGQQNVERIVLTGALPQNKESLFWLNIKAIPSSAAQTNALQIAVKTRIKLIYRPTNLKGSSPEEQANQLKWQRRGNTLEVSNPTQYVINFNEISLGGKKVEDVTFVLPGSVTRFAIPQGANGSAMTFKIINDYGSPGITHQVNASL